MEVEDVGIAGRGFGAVSPGPGRERPVPRVKRPGFRVSVVRLGEPGVPAEAEGDVPLVAVVESEHADNLGQVGLLWADRGQDIPSGAGPKMSRCFIQPQVSRGASQIAGTGGA